MQVYLHILQLTQSFVFVVFLEVRYNDWLFSLPTQWSTLILTSLQGYYLTFGQIWARGYLTFFMLNSAEHEILNAHKYIKYQEFIFF